MLAESAVGSALDKVTPNKLAGKFWRVVATSSLLGLLRGENGLIDGSTHLLVLPAESRWDPQKQRMSPAAVVFVTPGTGVFYCTHQLA
jgi:hypothetical protein